MRVGSIRIPDELRAVLPHFRREGPLVSGVSGGRTSALMHVLALAANGDDYRGVFANTGKEHERTLVFLRSLERATGQPLTWLEFMPPPEWGQEPKHARFQLVDFESANRAGRPFELFLRTLAEYRRKHKDEGPVAPHAIMRICTAYMKVKVMQRWALDTIGDDYDNFVGLRADEPERVKRLDGTEGSGASNACPLAHAGITKAMVLDFWSAQDFDLDIPEHLGNCNKCFLKDEADLAQSMWEEPEDVEWWLQLQETYGDFRRGNTSMRTVWEEAAVRMTVIRPALVAGKEPDRPDAMHPYRWKLVLRQERKRLVEPRPAFSCACESAQLALFAV